MNGSTAFHLKQIMSAEHLSLTQTAKQIGISPASMRKVLKDATMSQAVMFKINRFIDGHQAIIETKPGELPQAPEASTKESTTKTPATKKAAAKKPAAKTKPAAKKAVAKPTAKQAKAKANKPEAKRNQTANKATATNAKAATPSVQTNLSLAETKPATKKPARRQPKLNKNKAKRGFTIHQIDGEPIVPEAERQAETKQPKQPAKQATNNQQAVEERAAKLAQAGVGSMDPKPTTKQEQPKARATAKPEQPKSQLRLTTKQAQPKNQTKAPAKPESSQNQVKPQQPQAKPAAKQEQTKPVAKQEQPKPQAQPAAKQAQAKNQTKRAAKQEQAKNPAKPVAKQEHAKSQAQPVAKQEQTKNQAQPAVKPEQPKNQAKPVAKPEQPKNQAQPEPATPVAKPATEPNKPVSTAAQSEPTKPTDTPAPTTEKSQAEAVNYNPLHNGAQTLQLFVDESFVHGNDYQRNMFIGVTVVDQNDAQALDQFANTLYPFGWQPGDEVKARGKNHEQIAAMLTQAHGERAANFVAFSPQSDTGNFALGFGVLYPYLATILRVLTEIDTLPNKIRIALDRRNELEDEQLAVAARMLNAYVKAQTGRDVMFMLRTSDSKSTIGIQYSDFSAHTALSFTEEQLAACGITRLPDLGSKVGDQITLFSMIGLQKYMLDDRSVVQQQASYKNPVLNAAERLLRLASKATNLTQVPDETLTQAKLVINQLLQITPSAINGAINKMPFQTWYDMVARAAAMLHYTDATLPNFEIDPDAMQIAQDALNNIANLLASAK